MDEPIRILQCVTIMNRNGLENRLMDIYRNIDRNKVQFDFMTNRQEEGQFDEEIRQLGGRVYHLSRITPPNFIRYLSELRTFFSEHKEYKIVHSHLNTLSTWPLHAAKKAGIPVRIAHSRNASMDRNIKMLYKMFSRLFINNQVTDRFACSRAAGVWLFGKKWVDDETFHVIPNAIQLDKYIFSDEKRKDMRRQIGIKDGELAVVCVARFAKQKNHPYLFKVFKEIQILRPNSRLYLVGAGELENEYHIRAKEMHIENKVVFLGSRSDVGKILTAMDVFLFPSFYEGFGTVIIEAQCSQLPLIASDTIPRETKLCDCVKFMSIKDEPIKWAEEAIRLFEGTVRKDNSKLIREKGYDIQESYKWMEEFYLEKARECGINI